MKILLIGDIFSKAGRDILEDVLPTIILKSFDDEAIKLYDKLKEMDEFLIKGGPKRVIEVK